MLKNKLKNKKKKGFTLIELIVVLAVLAIIALIAIPNFNKIRENSKIKADQRGADLIDKAVTTLVLDGTIKTDGTYDFTGTNTTVASGSTAITDHSNLITGVLDKTKVQQDISPAVFKIKIENANTATPIVDVSVGTYFSDSSTK
ncbi:MAG: pilus assembly FimT family protein [Sarcina sp.]